MQAGREVVLEQIISGSLRATRPLNQLTPVGKLRL